MRINLQRFALSTLTFSLATTLAVAGFSESASARRGKEFDDSNNVPVLEFNAFYEKEGSTDQIPDTVPDDDNIGVLENAITILKADFVDFEPEDGTKTEIKDFFDDDLFEGEEKANLSASLNDNEITYQIYLGDATKYKNPENFLRFTPVAVSPDSQDAFVNNIKSILDESIPGDYKDEDEDDFSGLGVLGLAIKSSLSPDFTDLKVTQLGAPPSPSTSIPEPTTTLASIFALGFAGKFLRKSKKNNV